MPNQDLQTRDRYSVRHFSLPLRSYFSAYNLSCFARPDQNLAFRAVNQSIGEQSFLGVCGRANWGTRLIGHRRRPRDPKCARLGVGHTLGRAVLTAEQAGAAACLARGRCAHAGFVRSARPDVGQVQPIHENACNRLKTCTTSTLLFAECCSNDNMQIRIWPRIIRGPGGFRHEGFVDTKSTTTTPRCESALAGQRKRYMQGKMSVSERRNVCLRRVGLRRK